LTVVNVSFSVVMNAVAGPTHRYELMSRRWSILGITIAITVAIAGRLLDRIAFPLNYQVVFIGLSIGGLISYYFSSHIRLPDVEPPPVQVGITARERSRQLWRLVFSQREFVNFTVKRFVFLTGISLALPLFPLYYVRVVNASDADIGLINTAQSAILLVGYFLWTYESRLRGSRFVMVWTTLGLSLYPALVAATQRVDLIILYAGLAGVFQAGLDLVFFDELMKTVPVEYSATFVSLAQGIQHFSSFVAPMLGTWLAGSIGLAGALLLSAAIRLAGFALFAWPRPRPAE
jgi:Na+/melibiose symporter-like transporter